MADDPHDPTEFPSTLAYRGPLPKAAPLERLGQYRIIKPLGRGGMGVVYLAEDTQLHRKAALKVMRADYASDPEAMARFLREAQAAARLKHDHIVTIYQVGEEKGVPFLAMEYLTGKSLEEWLRPDRRATIVEALLISRQIARGLAAAHAAGLIHRDIKPANLWLEAPRGRVKILDFGLARHTSGEHPALTQDGSVVGTPAFMAPEQARGDVVDHRCDLFSLGCVMYRMLTGRLPFQGTTTFAVLSAIAAETPPSPIRIRDEIPKRLSDLVDQLLAKKPEQRPASAQTVLDALTEIEKQVKQPPTPPSLLSPPVVPAAVLPVATVPVAAPADTLSFNTPSSGPTVRLAKPARRKGQSLPAAWLALGGGVVVLILVGLLAVLINQSAKEEAALPKTPKRSNRSPPPADISVVKKSKPEIQRPQPAVDVARPTPTGPAVVNPARPTEVTGDRDVSTAPPVAPVVVNSSPLVPLTELNSPVEEVYPWVSQDGLEIYFGREEAGKHSITWRATRASIDAPFGTPSLVNSLRHAVLSSDGLIMVGLQKFAGSEKLSEATRASRSDAFTTPELIDSLQDQPQPKSPWLAEGGKYLVFQRPDKVGDYAGKAAPAGQQSEFVFCRRTKLGDAWSAPVRLPLSDHPLYTSALTWPSLSDDGLTLFFNNGGSRFSEIMYATRATRDKAFTNPRRIVVDGQPLIGRAPRYVAATRELYFCRDLGTAEAMQGVDLWKLTDFVPEEISAAAKPSKKPTWPKDAQTFGGHYYKFYPEQLTWHEAKKRCEKIGGHLAIVDSTAENGFLSRLVEEAKWIDAWIGITDEAQEGKWVTVLGKPVTYTNWFTGQPNNKLSGEHYALMSGLVLAKESINWRWTDQPNQALPKPHKPGYLCEWEPVANEDTNDEFVTLFDGKSLEGWQGDKSAFSVENGLLVGSGNRGNLYTEKQYADFELRFEFRLSARANSGILFRTPRTTWGEASFQGNEIQILDHTAAGNSQPWQLHGALYGVAAPKTGHLKPTGQWNSQTILCRGNKLQIVLNETTILDADLAALAKRPSPDDKAHPGLSNKEGYIGLMNHTNRVEFRNLQIKELK